jgi:23S rRNA pseudouridine2605 synthase
MKESEDGIRLHVYMARCGVGSRRFCEQLIRDGRVAVNSRIITQLGFRVSGDSEVKLDGRKLKAVERKVYIALNKPAGYLCSNVDREGRPLALDLLKGLETSRLFHVGRLDYMSSGIIFYTNDGAFAQIVSHPSYEIEKVYRVETVQPIRECDLQSFQKGIVVDGERFRLMRFQQQQDRVAYLTLIEGKNREIRHVFRQMGYQLKKVHRVKIGIVSVKGLASGQYRLLSSREREWFLRKARKSRPPSN